MVGSGKVHPLEGVPREAAPIESAPMEGAPTEYGPEGVPALKGHHVFYFKPS